MFNKEDVKESYFTSEEINHTVNGKCSCCGSCCGRFLPLTKREIKTIRQYVKRHHIQAYTSKLPVSENHTDFNCPFCDIEAGDKKCRIYEVRPEICRGYLCCNVKDRRLAVSLLRKNAQPIDMRHVFFKEPNLLELKDNKDG